MNRNSQEEQEWYEIQLTNEEVTHYQAKIKQNCIIVQDEDQEHWLSKSNQNYGYTMMRFKNIFVLKHRLSYWLANGMPLMPRKFFIVHKCRHRNCVNPNHLKIGSLNEIL